VRFTVFASLISHALQNHGKHESHDNGGGIEHRLTTCDVRETRPKRLFTVFAYLIFYAPQKLREHESDNNGGGACNGRISISASAA